MVKKFKKKCLPYLLLVQYNIKHVEFNMTICQKTYFIGDPVKWLLVGAGDSLNWKPVTVTEVACC